MTNRWFNINFLTKILFFHRIDQFVGRCIIAKKYIIKDKATTHIDDKVKIGENGNIFNLMAIASRTLRNNNMKELAREMETRIVKSSKSYEEALGVIAEYVEITDKESEEIEEY